MADGVLRASDYDDYTTGLCERAQLTLLKCAGPWGDRIYLTGGLAPRYLITELPEYARPHVGTTDVDLVVGVAVIEQGPEPYATLVKNMTTAGFRQYKDAAGESASFRWCIEIVTAIPCVKQSESLDRAVSEAIHVDRLVRCDKNATLRADVDMKRAMPDWNTPTDS